jgi:phage shock protein A
MSGIFSRFKAIFQAQAHGLAYQMEDPQISLDYSLSKLEQNRKELSRSLIEVSAARQRLAAQRDQMKASIAKYEAQAGSALKMEREDLGRAALERKQDIQGRLEELENNVASLEHQEDVLKENQMTLDNKIALFRSKKEELKSIYDSSKAQLRIRESLSGISEDLADVGNTIQRAEARIKEMQSRADAIDRLISEGVLTDVLDPESDEVDRELNRIRRDQAIEEELTKLKAQASV